MNNSSNGSELHGCGYIRRLARNTLRMRVRDEGSWAAVPLDRSERNRTYTLPISALARNFCTALSLSSLSAALTLLVAEVAGVTGAWGCMNASWGEGGVVDDEGVAMAAGRVARRVVVVADVVTGVQVDVEDEGRGAGQCLGRRGRVTGRDADGHTAARARRVEG